MPVSTPGVLKKENHFAPPLELILEWGITTVAGADIKEMKDKVFADAYKSNFLGSWVRVTNMRKPIIGAVAGYAVSRIMQYLKRT